MKKILFLGLAFVGFSLASCNKNSVSPDALTTNLTANAAAAGTDTSKGKMPPPKLDSISISSLPAAITSYISTNYVGATVQKAGKDKDGNYAVLILQNTTAKGLLFNSAGVFQKELPPPPPQGQGMPQTQNGQQGGTGNGQQAPPQLSSVDVKSLPSAITSYITTNYAGATIDKAGTDKDGNYYILISQNNQPKGLLFDAKGAFQKELPPPPPKKG